MKHFLLALLLFSWPVNSLAITAAEAKQIAQRSSYEIKKLRQEKERLRLIAKINHLKTTIRNDAQQGYFYITSIVDNHEISDIAVYFQKRGYQVYLTRGSWSGNLYIKISWE